MADSSTPNNRCCRSCSEMQKCLKALTGIVLQKRTDTTARTTMPTFDCCAKAPVPHNTMQRRHSFVPQHACTCTGGRLHEQRRCGYRQTTQHNSARCNTINLGPNRELVVAIGARFPVACSKQYPLELQLEDLDGRGPRAAKIGGVVQAC